MDRSGLKTVLRESLDQKINHSFGVCEHEHLTVVAHGGRILPKCP